ncbi:flagellin [Magnetospirillum moscoviense]|uniref:flagellin n=1 Tax=Magnetospirillum moscoviense TaxID=1437059 RepID=UPI0008397BA7|nr:flagellin [Magnetospirillum moscoviense]MBF0324320.1 flagellin [Alphaproteobacteria bacterium]
MADNVTLSSSIRTNLLTLQKTGDLVNRTNNRLSTGLRVASAVDDAVNYFQGKSLSDRAADLTSRKEGIDQGISSLKSAIGGLEAVEKLLVQMKGVLLSAKSSTAAERVDLASQFNTLATQLTALSNDASFQGLNLINATGANLKVQFSEKTSAILDVGGTDNRFSAMVGFTAAGATVIATAVTGLTSGWSAISASVSLFDNIIEKMDSAVTTVRSNGKTLGTNVALLQTRLDFTKAYVNTLKEGADKLTLADLNEEGANLVSLQTRQQLGIQALSFAGQQDQGILRLFG